jgi:hypothetical protein
MRSSSVFLALACAVVSAWSTHASAEPYRLSGNARFQVGNGLPVPIGFTAPPNGPIVATPSAQVKQALGADPKRLTIPAGQLTWAARPVDLPVAQQNPNVFQVHTSVGVSFPGQQAVFRAGGRTGAPTVTFCAGQSVLPSGNPLCSGPGASANVIHGLMRYTRTANQFGGPAQPAFTGTVNVAVRGGAGAPCNGPPSCVVAMALSTPPPLGAWGAPFGVSAQMPHPAPNPGAYFGTVNTWGTVLNLGTVLGAGLANASTAFGGPWTTGRVTVSVTSTAMGGFQKFTLTGSDNRVGGVGSISLVSGAIVYRALTGPEAARGHLTLEISALPPRPVPGLAGWGLGLLALLFTWLGLRRTARVASRPGRRA